MRILLPVFPRIRLPLIWISLVWLPALAVAQEGGAWDRVQKFDTDGDGKVTREEFQGPARVWGRLDVNGDGEVTRAEAESMRRRGGGREGRGDEREAGGMDLTRALDTDRDGSVSKAEWEAYFKQMDENGDGQLDEGELRAASSGNAYVDSAPKVGSPAPKIVATRHADGKKVELNHFAKPTVLVFGSWT